MFRPNTLDRKKAALIRVLEHAPIQFAWLFGSASRGEPYRDLDVAVALLEGADTLPKILNLGLELEKAAKAPVDLVPLASAPLALQYEVSKGVLLTSQDPEALADWKERTWNVYFEREHFLRSYAWELFHRLTRPTSPECHKPARTVPKRGTTSPDPSHKS